MIRDIQKVDDDIISMKRKIKQILLSDPDLIEALNNPDIDVNSPDEYFNTNIFSFIRIPGTQETVRNFVCYAVNDIEASEMNSVIKTQYIQFTVICHLYDMKTQYGIDRHDLLAYIIRDLFNWTNVFGLQFKLITNKEQIFDSDYYGRTLQFEALTPNSLQRGRGDNLHDIWGR